MIDVSKQIKELNKQLYPTGRAWGYIHGSEQSDTEIVRFVDGLGNPFVDGFGNAFIQTFGSEASPAKRLTNAFLKSYERYYTDLLSLQNQILADNDSFDETDASNWERVFGLSNNGLTLNDRKSNILRRQSYPAGIAERGNYLLIQDELQKAGFDVYVHENRFPDGSGGWEVQDPDSLATQQYQLGLMELGEWEMGADITGTDYTICANFIEESLDANFYTEVVSTAELGVSEFGEWEFETPSPAAKGIQLRASFFVGGSSFPSIVNIPIARKKEFRQLILKLKPVQTVAFLYINYI